MMELPKCDYIVHLKNGEERVVPNAYLGVKEAMGRIVFFTGDSGEVVALYMDSAIDYVEKKA